MAKSGKRLSLGGNVIYLTGSRVVVSMIGLVTSMLLARFRTLSEYGTYSQLLMVTDLVTTFLLLGLPNSINYFLAKVDNDGDRQKFMSVYLTMSTLLTIVIGVCLLLAMPLIVAYFDNPLISRFAYVVAVYPWASLMINGLGNVCVIYERTSRLILFNIIHAVSTLVILLLCNAFEMSFQQYMVAYMGSMLCFGVAGLVWIRKMTGRLRVQLDWRFIKEILVFSIPMGLASVVGTLNTELDKLVIGKFFSTQEYAIFANAAKELPFAMLTSSITAVLLPRMVRLLKDGKNQEAIQIWGNANNLSLCFMFLIAGGLFVFAPDVMSFLYSEKYVTDGGVAVFRIYTCILPLRAIYWGIVLNATGKTKLILYSSILTLFMNLVGNIASCYLIGFEGPAYTSLVATVVMNLVQLIFTCKIVGISMKSIFPWKDICRLILQTACLAMAFAGIKYGLLNGDNGTASVAVSVGLGVLWATVYGLWNRKFIKRNWKALNR